MLGPFPARLIRGASKTYAGYMNDLKAAKREHTHFIRRIKFLEDCLCQETRLSLIVRRCVPPYYYIRTDAVCLFMMRVSNIFNSKVFPSNILAGFDPSIQIWIDGPACLACESSRLFCGALRLSSTIERATMAQCANAESRPLFPAISDINRRQHHLSNSHCAGSWPACPCTYMTPPTNGD